MLENKNVINLGLLENNQSLPSGEKCVYYIYYKSDGNLYMYDSENDRETNLFTLQLPIIGRMEIEAAVVSKGILKVFAFEDPSIIAPTGILNIMALNIGDEVSSQEIIVYVKELLQLADGTLEITALEGLGGTLDITAYQASGTLEITALSEVPTGTVNVYIKTNQ